MSSKTIRLLKLGIAIISAGLTYIGIGRNNNDEILDRKIAEKVTEELAKRK